MSKWNENQRVKLTLLKHKYDTIGIDGPDTDRLILLQDHLIKYLRKRLKKKYDQAQRG